MVVESDDLEEEVDSVFDVWGVLVDEFGIEVL